MSHTDIHLYDLQCNLQHECRQGEGGGGGGGSYGINKTYSHIIHYYKLLYWVVHSVSKKVQTTFKLCCWRKFLLCFTE